MLRDAQIYSRPQHTKCRVEFPNSMWKFNYVILTELYIWKLNRDTCDSHIWRIIINWFNTVSVIYLSAGILNRLEQTNLLGFFLRIKICYISLDREKTAQNIFNWRKSCSHSYIFINETPNHPLRRSTWPSIFAE